MNMHTLGAWLAIFWLWPLNTLLALPLQQHDIQLAQIINEPAHDNPRTRGLEQLAWQVRRRTSIDIDLHIAQVDLTDTHLFNYPLLIWLGEHDVTPLPPQALLHLQHYLESGGSLLIDAATTEFATATKREIKRLFAGKQDRDFVQIPKNHVLYKTFYLLQQHGGRSLEPAFLEGIAAEGRWLVVLSINDLAGAMAKDSMGHWEYAMHDDNDQRRETTYRFMINWIMYTLCLDYKDDQVHVPFILQRRR